MTNTKKRKPRCFKSSDLCPVCGYWRWETIIKYRIYKCRNCGQPKEVLDAKGNLRIYPSGLEVQKEV
jgi:hypothetical protein